MQAYTFLRTHLLFTGHIATIIRMSFIHIQFYLNIKRRICREAIQKFPQSGRTNNLPEPLSNLK